MCVSLEETSWYHQKELGFFSWISQGKFRCDVYDKYRERKFSMALEDDGRGRPETWYREGLHFTCTQCGNCCTGEPGYVWVSEEEIKTIANYLRDPIEEVRPYYTREIGNRRSLRERPDGDCVFYDKGKGCLIYPVRPGQCKTWPFWESNLATEKDWQETCKSCPGAGQGELISAEDITRRLKVIRL